MTNNIESQKWGANLIGFLIFILVFTNHSTFASTSEIPQQWLKLLRYNKTPFGYKSEVDTSKYFFAKDGKTNPNSEMKESVKYFEKPLSHYTNVNLHPICLFPGRYIYLERLGKIKKKFNLDDCKDYKSFRDKLELSSVSVIFSSYFINKPASAFGHTLLKLNKEDPMTSDLNSYGVDFSAQVTTKNPFAYGILGILGGFYGRFSLLPYFLKLREYNDFESRDLWEFELNLNQSDLELLTAHLWDMNHAQFDYYYFTENCSYHVQRFIDAIKPEWKLYEEFYATTVPIDTLIPLVSQPNITKNIFFRPSLHKRSTIQISKLSQDELTIVKDIISTRSMTKNHLKGLNTKRKVIILDSIIDFIDYKFPQQMHLATKDSSIKDLKRQILRLRSSLPITTKKINKEKRKTFDYSHRSRKLGVGIRNSSTSGYEFNHRFALHNILEPVGNVYSDFSLEMGKSKIFYNDEDNEMIFEEFELAHVEALRPISFLEKKISWNFKFGARSIDQSIAPYFDIGIGPSFKLKSNIFSLFLQSENTHLFSQKKYQESLAGINLQWVLKLNKLSFKANYKKFKEFVYGTKNIEVIEGKINYNISNRFQLMLEAQSMDQEATTTFRLNTYY